MGAQRRRAAVEAPAITVWALVRGYHTDFEPDADGYSGTTWVYPVGADEPPWEIHFDRTIRLAICTHPHFGEIARGDLLDVLAEFDYVIGARETPPNLRPSSG
jgi:hypothetical protein